MVYRRWHSHNTSGSAWGRANRRAADDERGKPDMPRSCTVCAHDAREAIDRALAGGESVSGVATRYGLSWDAVKRHGVVHLPKAVVVAQARHRDDR